MKQKRLYDRRTRPKVIRPGDKVLVFLPTDTNKLLMQWKGPFEVVRQVARNDCKIKVGKDKFKVFHANMLKVHIDREVSQEAETAVMMAVIETVGERID